MKTRFPAEPFENSPKHKLQSASGLELIWELKLSILTLCKSFVPQNNHFKCIFIYVFLPPQIWFACSATWYLLSRPSSQAVVDVSSKLSPALEHHSLLSLPENFLWHYPCFLSLKQRTTQNCGSVNTLGEQYSVSSNPYPLGEESQRTRAWPRHASVGRLWCVFPMVSQRIHRGLSPRCSQWLSAQ